MGKYDDLAERIISCVGGRENINSLTHCATKLRFQLEDETKADTKSLKTMQGVITVLQRSGQYQVLLGSHAPEVYESVVELADIVNMEMTERQKGFLIRWIDTIADVFAPLLGVLCGVGILKGLLSLCLFLGWYREESVVWQIMYVISESMFYYLPIFVGFTAARKFQTNQFVGMMIGACFVYPAIHQMPAFPGSPLPVIVSVWAASCLSSLWRRFLPDVPKKMIASSGVLLMLIVVPIMYSFTRIAFAGLKEIIEIAVVFVSEAGPIAEGAFVGGFWLIWILAGLHGELSETFPDIAFIAACAQAGGVLAVLFKTKQEKLRTISISSVIAGVLGVPEPGIYGVTLPKKFPFLLSCIGASAGSAVFGYLHVCGYVWKPFGMLDWVKKISFITVDTEKLCNIALAALIGFLFTLFMVLFTYRERKEEKIPFPDFEISREHRKVVCSPLNGRVIPLSEVDDEVFASGVLGDGVAIEPYEGIVYAPADCRVTTFFPTGHAIGLTTGEGIELLIHIGMDTVQLNGEYFKPLVKQEERLKRGQPILEFDMKGIRKKGYRMTTPVIITNDIKGKKINHTTEPETTVGDALLWLG